MDSGPSSRPPWLKPALDFGPLLIFFGVNARWGLLPATAALVPLTVVALLISWRVEGRVSRVALFTASAVIVFGGLTLILADENFIKIKLTVVNALFGTVLAASLLFGKPLLGEFMGPSLQLTEAGWRILTLRFALFFFALAGLNEVLRRSLSSDGWVTFKTFGVFGGTFLFTVLQTPLLKKHALEEPGAPPRM